MHHRARSETGDVSSPRSSRAPSFSSDRPSVAGAVTFQMPSSIRPAPAYIAASVASQTVTDHHNAQVREGDDSDNDDPVLVNARFSEQALYLLNAFLDHLLFAFLSAARSPSLAAIRPAIMEVLKPRLAREAMAAADEELQGLLAGEDDEEFPAQDAAAAERWDVEKVWKRTRLRIMVYTRLGELEDEDEERYVAQERGLSMDDDDDEAGLVSWASAIFLTSVVEYVAEQTLLVSGEAAFARMAAKIKKLARQPEETEDLNLERIVVEDFDVEKLALNSALGRLWRTWRKRVRSPVTPLSPRGVRYRSSITSLHRRRISHDTVDESILSENPPEVPEHKPTETEIAANIPLPMGDNDINEIEVPGLARTFEEAESSGTQTPIPHPQRPASFIMLAPAESFRRRIAKERPVSMPPPDAPPFVVPTQSETEEPEDMPFETPMESMSDDESYIHDERQEDMYQEGRGEADGDHEPDADMVAFAASTGMGFGMSPISPVKPNVFDRDEDDVETPTQTGYDGETQVLQSKRMSIEKTGPPGLVRTFSTRSSSLRSHDRTPAGTPSVTPGLEPRSYLNDAISDDEMGGPEAIGVAHTTNVPVPTPSPPAEAAANGKPAEHARHPSHGGYVEVLPRQTAPTSMTVRNTPSPEERPTRLEAPVPRREVQRKEIARKEATASPPQSQDLTPPKPRATGLAAVQETETWPNKPVQAAVPEKSALRGSPSRGSPKPGSSIRSRESPIPVTERTVKLQTAETPSRSRSGTAEGGPVEKSSLQRASSSSSTGRSVSTSILHSARDSDISINGRPRGLSGRMSEEDRQREFDSLVKGEETVKFTLTPQNMRDIDEPPVVKRVDQSPKPTASAASVTVYPRVVADKDNQFGSQHLPTRSSSRSQGPVPSSGKKVTMAKPMAREPRIQGESMRDFADFIRSTGPAPGEERPVQPFVALNSPGAKPSNRSSSSIGGLGRKASMRQSSSHSHSNSTVGEGPSTKSRVAMEPRSPAGQRSGNDDLIDFIRQGPPGAGNGQHRIPRAVAPFRTTVDSDQFDRMLDENGNVESTYGSQVSTNSKQSIQTSNSRTGLLPKANVVQPAYSNTPQKLSGSLSNPEPHIQRTRRRVKDPYAIDSDDEDEDLLTALPPKGKTQREESLIDFLNSMEPPSNAAPQPLMLSKETIAAAKARAAKNAAPNVAPSPANSNQSSATAPRNGMGPRAGNVPSARPAVISNTITSDAPRANKPRLQARTAGTPRDVRTGTRSATNDLADFLRNSGPPEPSAPPPGATIRKDESKRMPTKFWRKKTYPDMP